MRHRLPSATVTFLFTDVEGSTRLLHELGAEAYAEALAEHRRVLRKVFAAEGGTEVDAQGDAFFYVFADARAAVAAAAAANVALEPGLVRVRMGLHTGDALLTGDGYVGEDVHLGARIAAVGHGGQVLLSAETRALVDGGMNDLGEHRLKDFAEPVAIFQLGEKRFPPLNTISNSNLPRPASSFVGRERETAEVTDLVRGHRLVTLSGPGGSGKTRLSIETASELVGQFKAGVFWVSLAAVRDPSLVIETVAQTLAAKDGLADEIGERELLLLLDNLEQVIEVAPELASLVEACPNLHLLVTSRELLRVRGEVEYPVPPLDETEAVRLFCERSGLDPDDTIAELCRCLDNLPLAVELAAARTGVLTTPQILDRLAQRLDLLKGGRDAEVRQRTLRATIEWSHDLLVEDEKQLFARLAVFVGGCTLDAAEQVADAQLDLLQSLVEKNLLRRSDERFWMLETIRELALEKLALLDNAEQLRRRHAEYLLEFFQASLAGRLDAVLAVRARAEFDNFRAAVEWALRGRHGDLALSLCSAAVDTLPVSPEIARWLEASLLLGEHADPTIHATALQRAAIFYSVLGDLDRAETLGQRSLDQFLALGDRLGQARALLGLGLAAVARGEHDQARERLERSLELAEEAGHPRLYRLSLQNLGELEWRAGNLARAAALLEEALQVALDAGDIVPAAGIEHGLGDVALAAGDTAAAEHHYGRALTLSREADYPHNVVAYCLAGLASVAATRGERKRAGRLWGASQAFQRTAGVELQALDRRRYEEALATATGPQFERAANATRNKQPEDALAAALADDV